MLSLEHLVQHYMKFSDGLPVNLRHPVQPKPKPPLPLFSTIPKNKANRSKYFANSLASSPPQDNAFDRNERKLSMEHCNSTPALKRTQRNLSIPSDDLMNQVGILSTSPNASSPTSGEKQVSSINSNLNKKSPTKSTDILNFRSLKLRSPKKNIIIDGMKSLKKSKASKEAGNKPKTLENNEAESTKLHLSEDISQSLKNLTFSADFKASDILYNVPTNNSAVKDEDIQNQNITVVTTTLAQSEPVIAEDPDNDRFTQSDKQLDQDNQDKFNSIEEIYFVDAPTKTMPIPSTSFNYVAFKQVPYFPDANQFNDSIVAESGDSANNNINNDSNNAIELNARNALISRAERIQSTASTISTESEFMHALQSPDGSPQKGSDGTVQPNYYIPKSSIILKEVLGEGEFGSVYQGIMKCEVDCQVRETKEIPVAIKTLHDEHCKENRAEFLREASVMIKLSHHCIVKLIGISKVWTTLLLELHRNKN